VTLLVDTSVWSLALRGDAPVTGPEVRALVDALSGTEIIVTTGLIIQELLQGFAGAKASAAIIERFSTLALLQPDRDDHIAAAGLRNQCRHAGLQLGAVDALIAQICIRNDLTLLSSDRDFIFAARHCPLKVWSEKPRVRRH
jgi:predicted nucleic acid-binding protein